MSNVDRIAVIGMAFRFPEASTAESFWQNLQNGKESISFFTDEELRHIGVDEKTLSDEAYVRARGIIDDPEYFDYSLFGYGPKEAAAIDPQQRVLLECAWHALEDAGYGTRQHARPVGVYACASKSTYLEYLTRNGAKLDESYWPFLSAGNSVDFLASRLAYKLNLRGPSLVVQTACSSSLVCVHLACQGLFLEECDMALAAAVSITIPQTIGYHFQEDGIMSPDGHCRAFDAQARGTVRGHGAAVLVLKRWEDAVADRDYIYAIIRGSAVNNDGAERAGFSAPSPSGQTDVIQRALEVAQVSPDCVSYVEAHGSGTAMGDPIEMAALGQAFKSSPSRRQNCAIGSVKTNIGHLDATAGLAGLIKTILCLQHGHYVPSLHYQHPNRLIKFEGSPFFVSTELKAWPKPLGSTRFAGVSSFGLGGTNCHIVLEEAPQVSASQCTRTPNLVLLSAKTASGLETMTSNLADYLESHPAVALDRLAFTLQTGREVFPWRRAVVAYAREQLIEDLRTRNPRTVSTAANQVTRRVSFVFSGLGEQYAQMCVELYKAEAVFREEIERCSKLLQPIVNKDLREVFLTTPREDRPVNPAPAFAFRRNLAQRSLANIPTAWAQPLQFIINYALAKLWISKGITPKSLLGYSLGEYVAATLAGVFGVEDALSVVARRAALIQGQPPGGMIAVARGANSLASMMGDDLWVSAVTGDQMCVVSGCGPSITRFEKRLTESGIACTALDVQHAFHSPMLEPVRSELVRLFDSIERRPPTIPFVSNVTGTWITEAQAMDPRYWGDHLCAPVLFADGVRTLCSSAAPILLEIGPNNSLSSLATLALPADLADRTAMVPTLCADPQKEVHSLYRALGSLWLAGTAISWRRFYDDDPPARTPLPGYPFDRRRCMIEPGQPAIANSGAVHPPVPARPSKLRERPTLSTAYVPARTPRETALLQAWQKAFGLRQIGVHDSFFELGGHSLLAVQMLHDLRKNHRIHLSVRVLTENPTIAALARRVDEADQSEFAMDRFAEAAAKADVAVQNEIIQEYVAQQVAAALSPAILSSGEQFSPEQIQTLTPHLILAVKQELKLQLYPHEIAGRPSVKEISYHLRDELVRRLSPLVPEIRTRKLDDLLDGAMGRSRATLQSHLPGNGNKNPSAIFILSAARSGSTLLRLMLAGHPRLFSPPELHLLGYQFIKERQAGLPSIHFGRGLQRALMELLDLDSKSADQMVAGWVEANIAIGDVYAFLQKAARGKCLVDKSPSYARKMETLLQAEEIFDGAKYIFLCRHPCSVIESYVRNRMYAISGIHEDDPYAVAEYHWATHNSNISQFLDCRPKSRKYFLRFEDLVKNPSTELEKLCSFLGIEFSADLLNPYQAGRMIDGPGDPNIHERDNVDSNLADSWKDVRLPAPLSEISREMAQRFGYDLPDASEHLRNNAKQLAVPA